MNLTEAEQPTSHTVVNKKIIENIQRIYKKGLQVELLKLVFILVRINLN